MRNQMVVHRRRSVGQQHAFTEQVESSPAEHLPLCHLKLVHIALYGSGAPALGQARVDGIPVATQVAAEAAQFGRTSLLHIGDPLIQLATAAFTYQTQEMLR